MYGFVLHFATVAAASQVEIADAVGCLDREAMDLAVGEALEGLPVDVAVTLTPGTLGIDVRRGAEVVWSRAAPIAAAECASAPDLVSISLRRGLAELRGIVLRRGPRIPYDGGYGLLLLSFAAPEAPGGTLIAGGTWTIGEALRVDLGGEAHAIIGPALSENTHAVLTAFLARAGAGLDVRLGHDATLSPMIVAALGAAEVQGIGLDDDRADNLPRALGIAEAQVRFRCGPIVSGRMEGPLTRYQLTVVSGGGKDVQVLEPPLRLAIGFGLAR